jgi:hypothetical protein
MNDVICIYAQRCDNDEVWEEANSLEEAYTGNTIAVIQNPEGGLSFDLSACGVVSNVCLDAFFTKIGIQMGIHNSIWRQACNQSPSLN